MSHSTEQLVPATKNGSSFVGRALIAVALLSAVAVPAASEVFYRSEPRIEDPAPTF